MYANNGNSLGYQVYPLTGTWNENAVTYGTKPGVGSQVASSPGSPVARGRRRTSPR